MLRYRQSLIALPALYLAAAILLGLLVRELDRLRDDVSPAGSGVDTARDLLSAVATGMIAFTGFVVAGVLVVVQFADLTVSVDAGVRQAFADGSPDLATAMDADRTGLGMARGG